MSSSNELVNLCMIITSVLFKYASGMARVIISLLCLYVSMFLLSLHARAQDEIQIPFSVTAFELENGLRVILSEDYSLPLVSVVIAYNVGSINEQKNKTGLAYMLENLMFQGSRNIGHMQHINFIQKIGGDLNAVTTHDTTMYYQTVPSNQLALVLWLESDRMMSLEIDPQKVARTRNNLLGEIQRRKTSDPYFDSNLYFDKLIYPTETYSHSVIGEEADLRELTIEDVRNFHSVFYTPNNAVLCITGNFEKRKTTALIRKYFSSIPRGPNIPALSLENHINSEEMIKTFENYTTQSPAFHLGYRIASRNSSDFYALTLIEYILLRGSSSRLYKKLVREEFLARQLNGGIETRKNLSTFKFFVRSNTNTMLERSQKAVFSELNDLRSHLIDEDELNKAKNMLKMDYINRYTKLVDRATSLAETVLFNGSFDGTNAELRRYLAVTPSAVIGIANRYFQKGRVLLNIKLK
ncbi:M16 family metallopeptidase [Acidobacteriota bacterium]